MAGSRKLDDFRAFLKRVVTGLNKSAVKYMITGALAVSYYGRARTTADVDVVVSAKLSQLPKLAAALRKVKLRTDKRQLAKAWRSQYRIATIENGATPHRLDVIFTNGRLNRKRGSLLGLRTFYEAPESLVLAKLRMIRATIQPERAMIDREDILFILKSAKVRWKILRSRARAESTIRILENMLRGT
jgi:hypothetical protein